MSAMPGLQGCYNTAYCGSFLLEILQDIAYVNVAR
jgi:hypothetical protein